MAARPAWCDSAEVAHVDRALAKNPSNIGVGVIDLRTGGVRLFPYDETDAFATANPHQRIMAGHEAAAKMAAIPPDQARGFLRGKSGGHWHLVNQSHLNVLDGQANTMRMSPATLSDIAAALQGVGVTPVTIQ